MKWKLLTKQERAETKKELKDKTRAAQVWGVFAKHNFYINGFTPEEMRTTLEDLGPTYVKIGQIMSSRTDLLPESYCKELEKLRSDVLPLDASVVRAVIEAETGARIGDIFSQFNDAPLGSASIAQAHSGVLLDGTRVVVKVQRPLIADMMRKDFVLLKKLAGMVSAAGGEEGGVVNLKSVVRELEKVTEEELDFRVEAENTRRFKALCIEDETRVSCPTILDELTTKRMLTMTFVDGYSISKTERVDAEGLDRTAIGTAIVENFLHQVLDVGVFHGDPHPGNILLSDGVPYWIDFGMIGHVSDRSIDAIQNILFALIQKDVEGLTNAALSLGKIAGKIDKTKLMDDVDQLMEQYSNVANIDLGGLMTDLTGLLSAYHISVPGEYTMLIRSIVTLQGVISGFCPELSFFPLLTRKMILRAKENFDLRETLTTAVESLAMTGLKTSRLPTMAFDVLRNLVKGRLKIGLELTGYDELLDRIGKTVRDVVIAVFACVIFGGSCLLCVTDVQPQAGGMPIVALIGLVVSVALALYAIISLNKKSR